MIHCLFAVCRLASACSFLLAWKLHLSNAYSFKGSFTVIISDHELTYLATSRNNSHDSPNQSRGD